MRDVVVKFDGEGTIGIMQEIQTKIFMFECVH